MTKTPADHFREMASRIERNPPEEFAGAIVIIPPGDGEPIAYAIFDPSPADAAQFWATLTGKIQIAHSDFQEKLRQRQGGGWR